MTYPDHPGSRIVFDTTVTAKSATEWSTEITVDGTYDGPTDVVAVNDYRVLWNMVDDKLMEKGSATLVLSSGESVRSEWNSVISARWQQEAGAFPESGESIEVAYSQFRIDGSTMSYTWEGSVRANDAASAKQ